MRIPNCVRIPISIVVIYSGVPLGILVFLAARPVRAVLRGCSGEEGFCGKKTLLELFHMCGVITLASILMYVGFWIVAGFMIGFYLSVSSKK